MKVCEMAEGLTDQAREADAARAWVATAEVAVSADLECSEKQTTTIYITYRHLKTENKDSIRLNSHKDQKSGCFSFVLNTTARKPVCGRFIKSNCFSPN